MSLRKFVVYRRRTNSDCWHWNEWCCNYPGARVHCYVAKKKPTRGELCNQCRYLSEAELARSK